MPSEVGCMKERKNRGIGGEPRRGNAERWKFHHRNISVKSRRHLKGIRIAFYA
jgi:hypothetical protein